MQKEFGERRNYSEIQRRIREHLLIADSGYFSTENLYHLFINKINALIIPFLNRNIKIQKMEVQLIFEIPIK